MRICIHRGTKEIGGTCVEIESQGKRVVLDVGLPLDVPPEEVRLHDIAGFHAPDASLLGVIISHPHLDHYGLANRLPAGTPFLIGEAAQRILKAAMLFTPTGVDLTNVQHLRDRQPITLGPFTITPYLVDHSAYDAYAILVEADGQRLFYTGDIRAHGRKASLFERLIKHPPACVNMLLMEGTTLGRPETDAGFPRESDLENHFIELFKATAGMPLVWCSGQNIDRIVTIFRACKRTGRRFIIDMYTAEILRATGNSNVPQADWREVDVFLPFFQKLRIKTAGAFDVSTSYSGDRIYPEDLPAAAPRSVMLFRPSMARDLEKANALSGARLICSLWSGYIDRAVDLMNWAATHGIPVDRCHTSGHASAKDLAELRDAFSGAAVVPIHTDKPETFAGRFKNVRRAADGVWLEVVETITPAGQG